MSDLIKREDAIKALRERWARTISYDGIGEDIGEECEDVIKAVPSADRPQGKWVCHEGGWKDFDYYPTKYECDQCHHYVDVASDKKFCPNCGADMRKGASDGFNEQNRNDNVRRRYARNCIGSNSADTRYGT